MIQGRKRQYTLSPAEALAKSTLWPKKTTPTLMAYYSLGGKLLHLRKQGGNYGRGMVETFCKHFPLKPSSVWACMRFAQEAELDDAKLLQEAGCSWRRVRRILAYKQAHLSDYARKRRWEMILDHVRSNGLEELDEFLKNLNSRLVSGSTDASAATYIVIDSESRKLLARTLLTREQAQALASRRKNAEVLRVCEA